MDSYSLDQLTEEVFGHLCNVAIDKCNDKVEKRRAGCGGNAMRKRVLIKNFVSDLLKSHGEKAVEEDTVSEIEYEEEYISDEDCDADTTIIVEEEDVDMDELLDVDVETVEPKNDCWLSGPHQPMLQGSHYNDYIMGSSLLSDGCSRDGAAGRADCLSDGNFSGSLSGSPPDSHLSMYDLYSNLSEGATEGGNPEPSAPSEGFLHSVPAHGFDGTYDLSLSSSNRYDLVEPLLPLTSLCDVISSDTPPLQPVRTEASDELFLAFNNNSSYSEMKTYTPIPADMPLPDDVIAPPLLTNLDAPQENRVADVGSPKKRRSNETTLYDTINAQIGHQKRIKL